MSSTPPTHAPKNSLARRKALADALAGVFASLVTLGVFYPFEILKLHAQVQHKRRSLNNSLYRGISSKAAHTSCSSFCYFYLYSWISSFKKDHPTTFARLCYSALAAMLNTIVTLPLDVVSTRHQASGPDEIDTEWEEESGSASSSDKEDELEKQSPTAATKPTGPRKRLARLDSTEISNLWKGLVPSLLLCTNPAIHYTLFDGVRARYIRQKGTNCLSVMEAFVLGLISKFISTILTYPLIQAKVQLMTNRHHSLWGCLRDEYTTQGVRGLYRGCNWQLLHTLLKSALLMALREKITKTTHSLLVRKQ